MPQKIQCGHLSTFRLQLQVLYIHQMYLHIILLNCITIAPEIFHLPSMAYDAWLTGDGLSCLSQLRKTLKRKTGWKRVVPTALSLCSSVISSRTYSFFLIVHKIPCSSKAFASGKMVNQLSQVMLQGVSEERLVYKINIEITLYV